MEYKLVGSLDEYKQSAKRKDVVPVVVTGAYIFVGPFVASMEGCVECFLNNLQYNGSFLYEILKGQLDYDLSKIEWDFLKHIKVREDRCVVLVSRKDFKVEYLPIHCHPLVNCENKKMDMDSIKIDWNYHIESGKRAKSGHEIFSKENNERLLNVHTGIGKRIIRDRDSSIVPMYFVKSHVVSSKYFSYGRAKSLLESKMSAEFEMLERYASIVPHRKWDFEGSYEKLMEEKFLAVSPKELSLNVVNDEVIKQYGFVPYSDKEDYKWIRSFNVMDEKEYYIPEQVAFYDAQVVNKEKRFVYETSNGCAMGGNYEEALVYALYELVERDAFLMHWYNAVAPIQLDIQSIDNSYLKEIVRYMTCIGYEVRIMDITMETKIPAIWVAAIDRNYHGKMKCYNAAGANLNPEKALEAALVEVVTSIGIYDKMIRKGSLEEKLLSLSGQPDEVNNIEDHVFFYSLEENFKYIEPYYQNEIKVDFVERFKEWYEGENLTFSIREFVERFRKHHKNIYVCVQDNEVNSKLGLCCVKVIVPSMLTMTFGVKNQRLNIERIQRGAVDARIRENMIRAEDINTMPHPFP